MIESLLKKSSSPAGNQRATPKQTTIRDFTPKTARRQTPKLSDLITRQSAEDSQLFIGCASANPRIVLDLAADLQPVELIDIQAQEIWRELQARRDEISKSDDDGRDIFFSIALRNGNAGRILTWIRHSILDTLTYYELAPRLVRDIRDLRLVLDKVGQLVEVSHG